MTITICIMIQSSQRAFTFITSFECHIKEMGRADVRTGTYSMAATNENGTTEECCTANLNFKTRFGVQGLFHRHNMK